MPDMWCATPSARCWWFGTDSSLVGLPFCDEAARLVGLDLLPFEQHAAAKLGIFVPALSRRGETVDGEEHLLHLRPMPVQGHGIAPTRPAIAEANHAADILQSKRGVDDGQ